MEQVATPEPSPGRVLQLRGVAAGGGDPLDLVLDKGDAVALIAPGGAGKRWLLRVAAGLRQPPVGTVQCAAARVAYVFSTGGLLANLSITENIVLPLCFAGVPNSVARARAADVLAGLGLESVGDVRPGGLAVEACQLVQIARAIALNADLIFLEEPFRMLSRATADEVAEWLRGELDARRLTVLMTASDVVDADRIGARVVRLGSQIEPGGEA